MTQEQLAEACGVRNEMVSRWEKGKIPELRRLDMIAEKTNVELTVLVTGASLPTTTRQRVRGAKGAPSPTPTAQDSQAVRLLLELRTQVAAIAEHVGAPLVSMAELGPAADTALDVEGFERGRNEDGREEPPSKAAGA